MDTLTAPERVPGKRADPETTHLVCCCTEKTAICGEDVSDSPWDPEVQDTPCPMCFAVEDDPCPFCGCTDCGWD